MNSQQCTWEKREMCFDRFLCLALVFNLQSILCTGLIQNMRAHTQGVRPLDDTKTVCDHDCLLITGFSH